MFWIKGLWFRAGRYMRTLKRFPKGAYWEFASSVLLSESNI